MSEVKKLAKREDIEKKYKWDIEKVYPSIEEWENDFNLLKEKALELGKFNGKLKDKEKLVHYLKLDEELSRLADKLLVYAHLRYDEDTSNTKFQALKDKIDTYIAEFRSIKAYFVPEILEFSDEDINEILADDKLKGYRFLIEDILKKKPHILNKEKEELLASLSDALDAPGNIFGMLSNADMVFPVIKDEEGNDVELSEGNYIKFIRSKDREVRKSAFQALFGTYEKYKNTFATTLTNSMKNFILNSKLRNYNSALECSLKPNNIPTEVFDKAIKTINDNLHVLHRYVSLKKKLLAVDEMHMYDLYVPIIDAPNQHIKFEDGVKIAKEGLKPLGEEYLSIFQEGIDSGWIDAMENKGKRGGAYSWGCYDTMPYILLNYNFTLNGVSTLAHEMGHSIHSYYSKKNQPYVYSDYELFCAEVASITNELLLMNDLINKEQDSKKKLYLVNTALEQTRTTVFRQIMFAEFEKIAHEKLEAGIPLTSENLCKIWHELNVKYFGPDMVVDKEIDMEWARIPHFYRDFYVYQYATGYAAANSFATMILSDGESAVEKYKGFLKSGGSKYPIDILKDAGVDMTTSKPMEDTINNFQNLLDILE